MSGELCVPGDVMDVLKKVSTGEVADALDGGSFNGGPCGLQLRASGQGNRSECRASRHRYSFMAIDLAAFTHVTAFKARMDAYIDEIKSSRKAGGSDVIYLPGEPEHLRARERLEQGIPLPAKVAQELRLVGKDLGVPGDF